MSTGGVGIGHYGWEQAVRRTRACCRGLYIATGPKISFIVFTESRFSRPSSFIVLSRFLSGFLPFSYSEEDRGWLGKPRVLFHDRLSVNIPYFPKAQIARWPLNRQNYISACCSSIQIHTYIYAGTDNGSMVKDGCTIQKSFRGRT